MLLHCAALLMQMIKGVCQPVQHGKHGPAKGLLITKEGIPRVPDFANKLRTELVRQGCMEEAEEVAHALAHYGTGDWYTEEGATRGILFHGPAGTGKSRLCKKLQLELFGRDHMEERTLFWGTAADLNSRYVGDTERLIRE